MVAKKLEECLYRMAKTKEEYIDPLTLKKRLQVIAFSLGPKKEESPSQIRLSESKTELSSVQGDVSTEAQQRINLLRNQNQILEKSMGGSSSGGGSNVNATAVPQNLLSTTGGQSVMGMDNSTTSCQPCNPLIDGATNNKALNEIRPQQNHDNPFNYSISELKNNLLMAKSTTPSENSSNDKLDPFQESGFLSQKQKRKVIKQQQQRLILLRHASKCTLGPACNIRFCDQMVELWNHMKMCRDQNCTTKHCLSSRCVLNHYRICKDQMKSSCEVCAPVMEIIRRQDVDIGGQSQNQHHDNIQSSNNNIPSTTNATTNTNQLTMEFLAKQQKLDQQQHQLLQKMRQQEQMKLHEQDGSTDSKRNFFAGLDVQNVQNQDNQNDMLSQLKKNTIRSGMLSLNHGLPLPSFHRNNDPIESFDSRDHSSDSFEPIDINAKNVDDKTFLFEDTSKKRSMSRSYSPNSLLLDKFFMDDPNTKKARQDEKLSPDQISSKMLPLIQKLLEHPFGWLFRDPVDPIELGIPDYFDIIKEPMDLSSVQKRLKDGNYNTMAKVVSDVNLVFDNAITYNGEDSDVGRMAIKLQNIYQDEVNKLE